MGDPFDADEDFVNPTAKAVEAIGAARRVVVSLDDVEKTCLYCGTKRNVRVETCPRCGGQHVSPPMLDEPAAPAPIVRGSSRLGFG